MNFNDFFKGMDKSKLEEGIKKANEFAKTKQGQDFINALKGQKVENPANLSAAEKEKLLKQITSNPELMRKIQEFLK